MVTMQRRQRRKLERRRKVERKKTAVRQLRMIIVDVDLLKLI